VSTIGRALLNTSADYDADTLKLLGRSFDAAWQNLAGNFDAATAENRRTRLALIILELAKGGERDEDAITAAAVNIMSRKERPATFNGW
jgi:hypothetical protein